MSIRTIHEKNSLKNVHYTEIFKNNIYKYLFFNFLFRFLNQRQKVTQRIVETRTKATALINPPKAIDV